MRMRRIRLVIAMAAMMATMVALSAPANAQYLGVPGEVIGWRWVPSQGWAYCDNFYDNEYVYWCYSENNGDWFRMNPYY